MKATMQNEPRATRETREEKVYVSPEVNIYENPQGYVLEAEMPGVSKDGLEITLEGNEITITGHRRKDAAVGDALFRERRETDYRRVFELDPAIDTTKIAARMNQGVLTLTLPKSERVQPRKITVD